MKRIAICIVLTLPACTDPIDTSDPTVESSEASEESTRNSADPQDESGEFEPTSAEVAAAVAVRTEEEVAHATTDAGEARFGSVELFAGQSIVCLFVVGYLDVCWAYFF